MGCVTLHISQHLICWSITDAVTFCSVFSDQPVPYSHTVFEKSTALLTVKAAVLEDAGVYSCVAVNDQGRAVCTAHVLVKGKTHVPFLCIIICQYIQNEKSVGC